jgi:hypothetical protein
MSEIDGQDLSGVAEGLLIPLYLRAMESQRPDSMDAPHRSPGQDAAPLPLPPW